MAHDEDHRRIVRSEIESALRRYLLLDEPDAGNKGDEGERETAPRLFSTNGGTMAIGCGCFLIRPGKPSEPWDSYASPPTNPRGGVESTADSTTPSSLSEAVLPSAPTIEKEGKPAGSVSTTVAGTADDGAGPPARSSSSSTDTSTTSGRVSGEDNIAEVGAEANRSNSLTTNDKGVTKNDDVGDAERNESKDDTVEKMERTTGAVAEVEVGAGFKLSAPRDNVDGATNQAGDDQNGEVGLTGVDGEQQMPDTASDRNSTVERNDETSAELYENSVLNALLSDMTSAADAWASASAARLAGVKDQERGAKTETPGCTAIVFLDAPVITPNLHPQPTLLRKKNQTQLAGPQRESLTQAQSALYESTKPKATAALSEDIAASSRGSKSTDVDSAATMEPATSGEPRDDVDEKPSNGGGGDPDAVGLNKQHPAGLGDPREALESLLAWMGEGDSSGCGRREVLLVCCAGGNNNPPLFDEQRRETSSDDDTSETSTTVRADRGSARGHGETVIQQTPDATRAKNDDGDGMGARNMEVIVRENDVNVILQGERGAEQAAVDGSEGRSSSVDEEERGDRPSGTIRQIILGRTIPIQITPEQRGQKPSIEVNSNQHHVDRNEGPTERVKVPAVVARMRNDNNNSGTGRDSSPTQPASSLVHLPPSEVLLQTRPAAPAGEGLSRVAVAFPPPTTPPAAYRPTRESEKCPPNATEEPLAVGSGSSGGLNDSVRVVVGPVIGRVSPTSGIVLVEVDSAAAGAMRREGFAEVHASDGVGVRLTDTLTGQARQMTGGTWTGGQPGIGPRVFEFEGLAPGRRYTLRLSGVRQRDRVS